MKEDYKAAMSLDLGIALLVILIATGAMASGQQQMCVVLLSGLTALVGGQQPKECSDLPSLTNGGITYTDGSTDSRPINTIATYTCNNGYTLTGGGVRACQNDRTWSGSAQTCQANCPDLPTLTNGMIMYSAGSPDNRPLGSSAVHSCNTGYTLTGGITRVCVTGARWSETAPTCQGPCSDLPPLMNGGITYTDGLTDSRPVNTIATYTCDNGYTLTGGSFRACQNGGTWDGTAPTCQATTCPDLITPTNGMISYNMGTTGLRPVNTVATLSCNTGFNRATTCQADRMWSGSEITCEIYLTLGYDRRVITTNNTEIFITDIGEDGGLPTLTCHTDSTTCCRSNADNNGNGSLGQWTYPNGSVILRNGASMTAGEQFYVNRNGFAQIIGLNRREANNSLTPTGSYCCTVPTSAGRDDLLC
ncbi:P-selectin-like isoform X2 [Halichondria panicea]|uniref:P-selectin-like isoform X2 n=1 Tax=Halichondria panicea TaxID=6063 RepID=UPI00312BBEBF